MIFIGYFMMFFSTLFIITGRGDIFTNFCWLAFMELVAVTGIFEREEKKRYAEVIDKIEEIE